MSELKQENSFRIKIANTKQLLTDAWMLSQHSHELNFVSLESFLKASEQLHSQTFLLYLTKEAYAEMNTPELPIAMATITSIGNLEIRLEEIVVYKHDLLRNRGIAHDLLFGLLYGHRFANDENGNAVIAAKYAMLVVATDNLPAIRCYEKLGFKKLYLRKGFFGTNSAIDAWLMQLDLSILETNEYVIKNKMVWDNE